MSKNAQIYSSATKQLTDICKITQNQDPTSLPTKLALVRQHLENLNLKLPYLIDFSVFKELDRLAAILEDDFIQLRTINHISKLAYSIVVIRKKLSQKISSSFKNYYDIRLMPSSLCFTFGSKPILGVLAHVSLKDKYETFAEEHVLLKIRKLISEARLVKGSIYAFQSSKSLIKTLYFEVDKRSGFPFTQEEIKRLKNLLKQEVQFCVEKLVPFMFMTRNEEEVLKNIFILSREIRKPSDLPEVMILLDQQTSQEAIFIVILVQVLQKKTLSIANKFSQIQGNFTFFQERCQNICYLKKKYPIEANVFRIHLPKNPAILRSDLSINFYLARQKVGDLLFQAIGDFRDFNGGIILKQREAFTSFIETFPKLSCQNPDLLETFFYSINPVEAQACLPNTSIKILFELFLEAQNFNLVKLSDYFLQFHQKDDQLFYMIRGLDMISKEILDQLLANFIQSQIITISLSLQNCIFLGYLITNISLYDQEKLKTVIDETLKKQKQKMESQQILKLGFEYTVVSLDPRIGGDQMSSLVLKTLFEGLMRENREGKIEYGIANSVEISSDLKTYIFTLRSARWSDGSLITAFDFEYAWKKVLSPSFTTPFAYLFYPIKNAKYAKNGLLPPDAIGIHTLDEITLKVILDFPFPSFLELTTHTIYSPVHRLIDQLHPNWPFEEKNAYICNGSFLLDKNDPEQGYELKKNPLYWDEKNIQLNQIAFLKMNHYQAFENFQKNDNHWVGKPLSTWKSHFNFNENDEIVTSLSQSMFWYSFNCEKFPFNNKKMRQAFSFAIDRKKLAKLLNTQLSISPLPLSHSFIEESPLLHFDPQKARSLFEEALEEVNFFKKDFFSLTVIHSTGIIKCKITQIIRQSWETILGVRCITESLEWNALFSKMTEGNYQVGCIAWIPWINDPMYTLNVFRSIKEPLNFPKWNNNQYQEILHLAEKEADLQKRHSYYLEAEKLLLEEMPVAPICFNPSQALKKKNLKIQASSPFINFKWAYFE